MCHTRLGKTDQGHGPQAQREQPTHNTESDTLTQSRSAKVLFSVSKNYALYTNSYCKAKI